MYAASFLRESAKLTAWACGVHVAVWHNNKRVAAERNVGIKHNSLINTSAWINEHIRTAAHKRTCLSGTPCLTATGQTWRSWKKVQRTKKFKILNYQSWFKENNFASFLFLFPVWIFFRPLKLNVNICTFIERLLKTSSLTHAATWELHHSDWLHKQIIGLWVRIRRGWGARSVDIKGCSVVCCNNIQLEPKRPTCLCSYYYEELRHKVLKEVGLDSSLRIELDICVMGGVGGHPSYLTGIED